MRHGWIGHTAGRALNGRALCAAFALALLAFLLTASAAGAKEPSAPAPHGFCTAMAKTGQAGEAFLLHPSLVSANRVQLAALTATNFLGLNAPAIASAEAQYAEMWAQDVVAMEGYHVANAPADTAPQLQREAAVTLAKVDADVKRTCPGDAKAYALLTAREKKTPLRP